MYEVYTVPTSNKNKKMSRHTNVNYFPILYMYAMHASNKNPNAN